ncbi:hypothetical protein QBC43DRAFT_288590 [Cladorrhinum sp. PSN259]|nr:hypothetical protein QBC43DRAFT_288590 [Cladorrhinum sp. PSN259]
MIIFTGRHTPITDADSALHKCDIKSYVSSGVINLDKPSNPSSGDTLPLRTEEPFESSSQFWCEELNAVTAEQDLFCLDLAMIGLAVAKLLKICNQRRE